MQTSMCVHHFLKSLQVWGNIQPYDDPSRLVLDLANREHWCPLNPDGSQPLASVQQELQYSETDGEKVMELQQRYASCNTPCGNTICTILAVYYSFHEMISQQNLY